MSKYSKHSVEDLKKGQTLFKYGILFGAATVFSSIFLALISAFSAILAVFVGIAIIGICNEADTIIATELNKRANSSETKVSSAGTTKQAEGV